MTLVDTDWDVTRATGAIRYIGDDHSGASPSYATVIEFHRWLQDLADDASSVGDDEIDITDEDPSKRSTDNIITLLGDYNVDDTAIEHLYDGSIIQDGGATIYDGIVNFGNADVQIQIIQNGAILADDWWNYNNGGLNADATSGISHRFLLKTRTGGANIDNRRIIGTNRRFGYTYGEFVINATAEGNNVLALKDSADLNNQTAEGTVAGWNTIVNNSEGYIEIDVNNDGTPEPYYSEWDKAAYSINQFFEREKWLTRDGSSSTLYGLNGELFRGITHQIVISSPSGTFVEPESLSWGTGATAGTGQLLAIDSVTAGTKMWIQLLTGVAPNGNTITGNGGATATAGTITQRSISTPICGASTGSALISSYGFALETADLTKDDKIQDLNGVTNAPPNLVTYTVGGLVSGEDRILVAPWDGSSVDAEGNPAIDKNQMITNAGYSGAAVTSVVMTTTIPSDTPATGGIRIETTSGKYQEVEYTSWSGSTFTIVSTDFSGDIIPNGADVWIAYIDELATGTTATFQSLFNTDRDLVVICRDGGVSPIKQFISAGSLGSSGGSITVIRTSDE